MPDQYTAYRQNGNTPSVRLVNSTLKDLGVKGRLLAYELESSFYRDDSMVEGQDYKTQISIKGSRINIGYTVLPLYLNNDNPDEKTGKYCEIRTIEHAGRIINVEIAV